jgi:hypothetical protein
MAFRLPVSRWNVYKVEPKVMQNAKYTYATRRIPITAFESSGSLKNEIRKIARSHKEDHWEPHRMTSKGSYINLCFRKIVALHKSTRFEYADSLVS